MTINPEARAEAAAAAEPRPSTSRAALNPNETRSLRVHAHKVGVWIRQATKKEELKKEEAEADLKKTEQEIKDKKCTFLKQPRRPHNLQKMSLSQSSVRPKPLFWFMSNTETQIGRYFQDNL